MVEKVLGGWSMMLSGREGDGRDGSVGVRACVDSERWACIDEHAGVNFLPYLIAVCFKMVWWVGGRRGRGIRKREGHGRVALACGVWQSCVRNGEM